jgi:hypothetical protein
MLSSIIVPAIVPEALAGNATRSVRISCAARGDAIKNVSAAGTAERNACICRGALVDQIVRLRAERNDPPAANRLARNHSLRCAQRFEMLAMATCLAVAISLSEHPSLPSVAYVSAPWRSCGAA